MRFERIVVGVDRDGLADHALAQAMTLAGRFDARLHVLHAVDVHPPLRGSARAASWAAATEKALAEAHAALEGKLDLTVEHPRFAELPVGDYAQVVVGRPAQALLGFAEEHDADLIVLGPHEKHGLVDFGGTTRAVLARSRCPVWVQPCEPRDIGRVLAAVDLSDSSDRVLAQARELALVEHAPVTVLHVVSAPPFAYDEELHRAAGPEYVVEHVRDEARREFEALVGGFDWKGVEARPELAEGIAHEEILARHEGYDLVVAGTHGRSALARAVLGSEAYQLARATKVPALLVPLPPEHYAERG